MSLQRKRISDSSPIVKNQIDVSNDLVDKDQRALFEYTLDIIAKQYEMGASYDTRVQGLIAVDAALLAISILILERISSSHFIAVILCCVAVLVLFSSFVFCVRLLTNTITAKIGNDFNLRTSTAIRKYTKKEYYKKMKKLDLNAMIRDNCHQISGLCRINLRRDRLLKIGIGANIFGALFLVTSILLNVLFSLL